MRTPLLLAAAFLAVPFATAAAQTSEARNVISIQPLGAMLTVYAVEFERAASPTLTWGVGATYWDAGDEGDELSYNSADLKVRYYPGTALHGFSFGGSLGYASVGATSTEGVDESVSGLSVGVLLEYQWLLGAKRNFSVSLGGGAKALMVKDDEVSSSDFTARYPTGRLSIGYAF